MSKDVHMNKENGRKWKKSPSEACESSHGRKRARVFPMPQVADSLTRSLFLVYCHFLSSFSLSLHFPLLLARGMSPLWELTSHVRWLATGSPTHRPPTPGHGPIEPITPWGPSKWASHEDIKCRGGKAAIQMCGPHSKSPTQRSEQNMWRFHSTYHLPLARLLGLQWIDGAELGFGISINKTTQETNSTEPRRITCRTLNVWMHLGIAALYFTKMIAMIDWSKTVWFTCKLRWKCRSAFFHHTLG